MIIDSDQSEANNILLDISQSSITTIVRNYVCLELVIVLIDDDLLALPDQLMTNNLFDELLDISKFPITTIMGHAVSPEFVIGQEALEEIASVESVLQR